MHFTDCLYTLLFICTYNCTIAHKKDEADWRAHLLSHSLRDECHSQIIYLYSTVLGVPLRHATSRLFCLYNKGRFHAPSRNAYTRGKCAGRVRGICEWTSLHFVFISHTCPTLNQQFELLADFIERINTNNWGNLGVSPWKDMVFSPFVIEPWHYCQPCLCTQPIYCKRSPMWRLCRHMHTHYTLWVQ